jgi:hypothetical protein
MSITQYHVIVSNIGTVYIGENRRDALAEFESCKGASKGGVGRMDGEPVTLFENGEILREYVGTQDNE